MRQVAARLPDWVKSGNLLSGQDVGFPDKRTMEQSQQPKLLQPESRTSRSRLIETAQERLDIYSYPC